MGCLGNCIWFLCGGILSGLSWVASGVLCCITIIGIPIGMQCFKFAGLAFFPFGKEIVYGGGAGSLIANIIWLLCCGIPMAVENACLGLLLCITIVEFHLGFSSLRSPNCRSCRLVQRLWDDGGNIHKYS